MYFIERKKRVIVLLIILMVFVLSVSHVFANPAGNDILISEVEYDPSHGGGDQSYEWFELFNPTAHSINISGYEFTDGEGTPVAIPNGVNLGAGEYYLAVFNTANFQTEHAGVVPDLEYGGLANANNFNLGNGGDEMTLKNSMGTDVDFVSWESHTAGWNITAGAGESIERNTSTDTDAVADWDGHQAPTPGAGSLTLTNHSPDITSNGGNANATIHMNENTTAVTGVFAVDPDAGDVVSYAILDGADQAMFSMNAAGDLVFLTAPDFENPTDADADGTYEVRVRATDGFLQDVQAISVVVDDVNEAPVITSNGGGNSASINVSENTTAVTTVTATDEDQPAQTLTYSLITNMATPDSNLFTIDVNTGELSFITAPDFENPTDQGGFMVTGGNNRYEILVNVSDGTNNTPQYISVIVTDVAESTSTGHSRARRSKATKKQSPQQKQKQALLKQIEELQRLIKDIQAQKKGDDRLAKCPTFNQNLRKGSRGEEVRKVQTFLKQQELFTFPTITGYYGNITQKAVAAFQAKYYDEILKPLGLTNPTGNWFGKTRTKANQLNTCLE